MNGSPPHPMNSSRTWTAEDNKLAEAELKLSEILTEELTRRPEISLRLVYASLRVQERMRPILEALVKDLRKQVKIDLVEFTEPERRRVFVILKAV